MKVRRVFTVLSVLFLLFLFIFPSLYLKDRCAELDELCGQVLFAARSGDAVSAQRTYVVLRTRYEQMRRKAELFLNHGVIRAVGYHIQGAQNEKKYSKVMDDATVPLHEMDVYLKTGDTLALEAAAVRFRLALDCMLAIETGDLRLFL